MVYSRSGYLKMLLFLIVVLNRQKATTSFFVLYVVMNTIGRYLSKKILHNNYFPLYRKSVIFAKNQFLLPSVQKYTKLWKLVHRADQPNDSRPREKIHPSCKKQSRAKVSQSTTPVTKQYGRMSL